MKKIILSLMLINSLQLMALDESTTVDELLNDPIEEIINSADGMNGEIIKTILPEANVDNALMLVDSAEKPEGYVEPIIDEKVRISPSLIKKYSDTNNTTLKVKIIVRAELLKLIDDDDDIGVSVEFDSDTNKTNVKYVTDIDANDTVISKMLAERRANRAENQKLIFEYVKNKMQELTGVTFVGDTSLVGDLTLQQLNNLVDNGYVTYATLYRKKNVTPTGHSCRSIRNNFKAGNTFTHNGRIIKTGIDKLGNGGKGVLVDIIEVHDPINGDDRLQTWNRSEYDRITKALNNIGASASDFERRIQLQTLWHWYEDFSPVRIANPTRLLKKTLQNCFDDTSRLGKYIEPIINTRQLSDHAANVVGSLLMTAPEVNIRFSARKNAVIYYDGYDTSHEHHEVDGHYDLRFAGGDAILRSGEDFMLVNRSYGSQSIGENDRNYKTSDGAIEFDEIVTRKHFLNVTSAGNGKGGIIRLGTSPEYICDMGLSRNAVTVGGYESDSFKSDGTVKYKGVKYTSHIDTKFSGRYNDNFQKPEILGPYEVTSYAYGGIAYGTSFASPVITGFIASQLSEYKDGVEKFAYKPEALKLMLLLNSTRGKVIANNVAERDHTIKARIPSKAGKMYVRHSGYGTSSGMGLTGGWQYWFRGEHRRIGACWLYDPDEPKHYNLQIVKWNYSLNRAYVVQTQYPYFGSRSNYGKDNNYKIIDFIVPSSGWYYYSAKGYKDYAIDGTSTAGVAVGTSYVWRDYKY